MPSPMLKSFGLFACFLAELADAGPKSCVQDQSCPVANVQSCLSSEKAADSSGVNLKHREDYTPPPYSIDTVHLSFDLDANVTEVSAQIWITRNDEGTMAPLVLNGADTLTLVEFSIEDYTLSDSEDTSAELLCLNSSDHSLVIQPALIPKKSRFMLSTVVQIEPQANTKLFGLYVSNGILLTQNEAEGFRRITYYLDRPDVLATYSVTLRASKKDFPVLLSNGDLVDERDLEDGYHAATYLDPFPKPSYLFALVAGDLDSVNTTFTVGRPCTEAVREFYDNEAEGADLPLMKYCKKGEFNDATEQREVNLYVWGEPNKTSRLTWALESIEKAMLWDEVVYGRYYDLDEFHVVAVRDFNAGAMENKGLNVFNTALIEASPETTTDSQYQRIRGVIAHEYFHNWSGDRVTVRDWFQLSLKEGLTVFRDEEFTSNYVNSTAKRIRDVKFMEEVQFEEDASPLRHPIRPDTYGSIENFYTVTVYEKGAEVIRMYRSLLGWENFRRGTDIYFKENDGEAATCEDFRKAMEQASGRDLSFFFRWYSSSGTPVVKVLERFQDPASNNYTLRVRQEVPNGGPLLIPLVIGLIDAKDGHDLMKSVVEEFTDEEHTYVFPNITQNAIPTLNRGFSAPIIVDMDLTAEELLVQSLRDSCRFIRWHAGQELFQKAVLSEKDSEARAHLTDYVIKMVRSSIEEAVSDTSADLSAISYRIRFPSVSSYSRLVDVFDPQAIFDATQAVKSSLVKNLTDELWRLYDTLNEEQSSFGQHGLAPRQVAVRMLKNEVLSLLSVDKVPGMLTNILLQQIDGAHEENDAAASLFIAVTYPKDIRALSVLAYLQRAENEDLLMDRWLAAQAGSTAADTIDMVKQLAQSHYYAGSMNPNRIKSLVGTFSNNDLRFNDPSGRGYEFVADEILRVDAFNPKVAARLATAFSKWAKLPAINQEKIITQINRIIESPTLSPQTQEIMTKAKAAGNQN